jgi:hypothetical protein
MEELIDLIATDSSPADVSSRIKELLYTKAAQRVDDARPYVASAMFNNEIENEVDDEDQPGDNE